MKRFEKIASRSLLLDRDPVRPTTPTVIMTSVANVKVTYSLARTLRLNAFMLLPSI